MKKFFARRLNIILISVIAALLIAVGVTTAVDKMRVEETIPEVTVPTVNYAARYLGSDAEVKASEVKVDGKNAMLEEIREEKKSLDVKREPTEATTDKAKKTEKTKKTETNPPETQPATAAPTAKPVEHVYATAAPVSQKASYSAQWNAGYILAIDNPDTSYSCPHIELSDDNRELLERLCMGEYGSGGFVGAALIAQCVKDAMHTYGIQNVSDIISQLHYSARTDREPSTAVKKAVVYIFDMDQSAVQHRIMYMYNPELMSERYSSFHESQKYICNYGQVRFFDR